MKHNIKNIHYGQHRDINIISQYYYAATSSVCFYCWNPTEKGWTDDRFAVAVWKPSSLRLKGITHN